MRLRDKYLAVRRDGAVPGFERYRREHGDGDPEAPAHRPDDPGTAARFRAGSRRVYPEKP